MDRLEYIKNLSEYIYENVSEISYGIKGIDSIYRFYSSFAISKAEYSKLSMKDALFIQKNEVSKNTKDFFKSIKRQVDNLSLYKKDYHKELRSLHDKLEYYNVVSTMSYIKESNLAEYIKKSGISDEIILDLHHRLTFGLDELFYKKLPNYDLYFSGEFRTLDNIRVGNKDIMKVNLIKNNLNEIYKLSKCINSLDDVFFIHAKLYHSHPFSNGNKRVCRILEEIYIFNLGVEPSLSASHGYYLQEDKYIKQIYLKTIKRPLFNTFKDFGFSSLVLSGLYLLHIELSRIKKGILKSYDISVFKMFHEGEVLRTKDLLKMAQKNLKISEQHFYFLLNKEKNILGGMVIEEKRGKSVYYALKIKDSRYLEIKAKIQELGVLYKSYNEVYFEIGFLKNYDF